MKEAKRQPPAVSNVMQGVELRLSSERVTVAPTERRKTKLLALIDEALVHVSAGSAATLAGKGQFYASSAAGRVGRAPLAKVYERQYSDAPAGPPGKALRAARLCLK